MIMEELNKAFTKEGKVPKKITAMGKHGAYQTTVWVKADDKKSKKNHKVTNPEDKKTSKFSLTDLQKLRKPKVDNLNIDSNGKFTAEVNGTPIHGEVKKAKDIERGEVVILSSRCAGVITPPFYTEGDKENGKRTLTIKRDKGSENTFKIPESSNVLVIDNKSFTTSFRIEKRGNSETIVAPPYWTPEDGYSEGFEYRVNKKPPNFPKKETDVQKMHIGDRVFNVYTRSYGWNSRMEPQRAAVEITDEKEKKQYFEDYKKSQQRAKELKEQEIREKQTRERLKKLRDLDTTGGFLNENGHESSVKDIMENLSEKEQQEIQDACDELGSFVEDTTILPFNGWKSTEKVGTFKDTILEHAVEGELAWMGNLQGVRVTTQGGEPAILVRTKDLQNTPEMKEKRRETSKNDYNRKIAMRRTNPSFIASNEYADTVKNLEDGMSSEEMKEVKAGCDLLGTKENTTTLLPFDGWSNDQTFKDFEENFSRDVKANEVINIGGIEVVMLPPKDGGGAALLVRNRDLKKVGPKTIGEAKEMTKKSVEDLRKSFRKDTPESTVRNSLYKRLEERGIEFIKSEHDGINWMRALMAMNKHYENGGADLDMKSLQKTPSKGEY